MYILEIILNFVAVFTVFFIYWFGPWGFYWLWLQKNSKNWLHWYL